MNAMDCAHQLAGTVPGVQPVSHAAYLVPQRRQKMKCLGYRRGSTRLY
jgi:hypothetical protein